jgi:hypothetical protein
VASIDAECLPGRGYRESSRSRIAVAADRLGLLPFFNGLGSPAFLALEGGEVEAPEVGGNSNGD